MAEIILTGTRAYGPARPDSDWDLVMNYFRADNLRKFLDTAGVEYEVFAYINPVYHGFKFNIGTEFVQVICANNEEDLDAWKAATNAMKRIKPIQDRGERIAKFQSFYKKAKGEDY